MLILCKAWAPRRRLCDVQNGRKAFVSPASHLISISVSEKQDFKKVMLILAVFSWRRREMLFFFVQTQETIKADFSQITAEVTAQKITVSGEWQAHATSPYAAFFCHSRSSSVCEKETERRTDSVFFRGVPQWKECAGVSQCLFHSQWSLKLKWWFPDLTQDLCTWTRQLSCFLKLCLLRTRFWRPPLEALTH